MTNTPLPLPNPHDWTDTTGAALIIGVGRMTVTDMVTRGALNRYLAGNTYIYWVPECQEVAAARRKLRGYE